MLYEVNVNRIQAQLTQLNNCSLVLEELQNDLEPLTHQFAVARALHLAVECIIDISNSLIDGFIMRDPGGCHDIVDIMEDEKVITAELASNIHKKVDLRDRLVRYYHLMQPEELWQHSKDADLFGEFTQQVTEFLKNERAKGNIAQTIKK